MAAYHQSMHRIGAALEEIAKALERIGKNQPIKTVGGVEPNMVVTTKCKRCGREVPPKMVCCCWMV